MRRLSTSPFLRRLVLALLLAGTLLPSPPLARAAEEPKTAKDLYVLETKALLPLLRSALKEDYRRQAWWLATRIAAIEAKGTAEAEAALKKWAPADLEEGQPPAKPWVVKRDAAMKSIGDAYAALARTMQAAGAQATETAPLLERAWSYGSKAPDAAAALAAAHSAWKGSFGAQPTEAVEKGLGTLADAVGFPPEYDDDLLRVRIPWPEAHAATLRRWRLVTGAKFEDACHTLVALSAQESQLVATFGSNAKEPKEDEPLNDLVVVPDVATYDRLLPLLFHGEDPAKLAGTSGWWAPWRHRTLVLATPRDLPWVPADAALLGWAAKALLARHLGGGVVGRLNGRGAWIVDGIAGLYEGFVPTGPDAGTLEPLRMWRLAASKSLKAHGGLVPWPKFFELDHNAADAWPKQDVALELLGEKREAKQVDVVAAQATAVALSLLRLDTGKVAKKLAALLEETIKRDRLPELDKALGTKPGASVASALDAMELATGK